MSYITLQELRARHPAVKTILLDSDVSSGAIYYAEREVESLLSQKYTVPFDASHPTVKDLCLDMSFYKILFPADPEKAQKIYDAIMKKVDKLLDGSMMLMTGSGSLPPSGGGTEIWSTTMGYTPVHSLLGARHPDTQVDPDLIEDLEDERD